MFILIINSLKITTLAKKFTGKQTNQRAELKAAIKSVE